VKRHDIDPLSLVFGLMFAAAGALFMSANLDFADVKGEWVWPIPFVLVGIVLLVSALARKDDEPVVAESQREAFEEEARETSETKPDEAR
jgi:cytochrome c-type biogenesis protein CcmH/NrfF